MASLTCAHDLLRLGYAVDVYEMMRMPGGMLTYGVPSYRLKNEIAINECSAIEYLGAKIHYNMKVGRDITLTELQQKYDAVFIGVGLMEIARTCQFQALMLPISFVVSNICVCAAWMRNGKLARIIMVVGGGNVAFDVARTSVRNGAKTVTMVCLESRDEQTADEFEIEDGMEEGITIHQPVGTHCS